MSNTKKLVKGGIYKHYKGMFYLVEGIVNHSETLEELVLYTALYNGSRWVRPKSMFLEDVDIKEYNYKGPRFTLISEKADIDIKNLEDY